MTDFSILEFIAKLAEAEEKMQEAVRHGLTKAAEIVEAEAKESIGTYQDAAGPFVPWAELADATKSDRVAQGFSENEHELRTGELRDGIGHSVEMAGSASGTAVVGSASDVMVYQELGTSRMPPRSILGGAAVRKTDEVVDVLAKAVLHGLTGRHG